MSINDTKAWMDRARTLNVEIIKKRARLKALQNLATSTTAGVSDMPRSDSPNLQRMETVMCRVVDLEREIRADERRLVCVRDEIRGAIALLEDPREITALNDRYLEYMSIANVAENLMVTERHAWKVVRSGMATMSTILQDTHAC